MQHLLLAFISEVRLSGSLTSCLHTLALLVPEGICAAPRPAVAVFKDSRRLGSCVLSYLFVMPLVGRPLLI